MSCNFDIVAFEHNSEFQKHLKKKKLWKLENRIIFIRQKSAEEDL